MNTQDEAVREALRILEAAGIKPLDPAEQDEIQAPQSAAFYLREHAHTCAERAEREAEDAKVDAYRVGLIRAVNPGLVPTRWGVLTDGEKGNWRTQYRAAREFFQSEGIVTSPKGESKPAPRVLHHGDPEPISVEALAKALGHELPEQDTPRVLNYGGPEPDRGAKWRDKHGDTWEHDGDGWHWGDSARYSWDEFQETWPEVFPMTEVLS